MSAKILGNESRVTKHLQQDLHNELNTANQLLKLISVELQKIKHFTRPGGDFEVNVLKNTSIIKELANLQQVDLQNLPPFTRKQMDMSMHANENVSSEEHNTFRNDSVLSQ